MQTKFILTQKVEKNDNQIHEKKGVQKCITKVTSSKVTALLLYIYLNSNHLHVFSTTRLTNIYDTCN